MGLSQREGTNLIRSFTKVAEPLPIDPRWNRLWAQVWEGPQGHPDEAEPFWRRYLDDLDPPPRSGPRIARGESPGAQPHGPTMDDLASDLDSHDAPSLPGTARADRAGPPFKDRRVRSPRRPGARPRPSSRRVGTLPLAPGDPPDVARPYKEGGQPRPRRRAAQPTPEIAPR